MKKNTEFSVLIIFIIIISVIFINIYFSEATISRVKDFCYENGWHYNREYTSTPFACWKWKEGEDDPPYTLIQRLVGVSLDGSTIWWIDSYGTNETEGVYS